MTQANNVAIESSQINSSGVLQVAGGGTGTTTSTGTGALVLNTSPTLTTPLINQINTSVTNTSLGAGNASIMKNRIINGAMVIDQRDAGASVTIPATTVTYTLDRYYAYATQASKFSVQQNAGSVTPPVGFNNYLGVTSLSSYSVTSTDQFIIVQPIEGFNTADLGWGTANAKTVTLSFQVYSSLTGTFAGGIQNGANNRAYSFSYSIPVANTWTPISITIAGDVTGTWVGATNGIGMAIALSLGAGSNFQSTVNTWATGNYKSVSGATSVVGTNGATFYITGVQLEVGSSATGFEYRQYQQELALCQRYYQSYPSIQTIDGYRLDKSNFTYPVQMRATPTITAASALAYNYVLTNLGATWGSTVFPSATTSSGTTFHQELTSGSIVLLGMTTVTISAEL